MRFSTYAKSGKSDFIRFVPRILGVFSWGCGYLCKHKTEKLSYKEMEEHE